MTQSRAPRPATPSTRRRSLRRRLSALGGVLVLTATATACSSGGSGVETPNITVGLVKGIGAATFELGMQQNLFAQAGLTVSVQSFNTDVEAETALKNSQVQIAFGDYSEILDKGSGLSGDGSTIWNQVAVVGPGYDAGDNTIGLVVPTGSQLSVKAPSTLAGDISSGVVTVEVPAPDSPEYLALANWAIAQQNPLNPTSAQIKAPSDGTDGADTAKALIGALLSGAGGAAVLSEPYLTAAIESGKVTEVANLDTGNAQDMPVQGYFALKTFAKSDPNTLSAFQSALAQSQALGQSRMEVEAALTSQQVAPAVVTTAAIGDYPIGIVPATLDNELSLMQAGNLNFGGLTAAQLTSTS